jgi:Asp-tRNA(Asn)/Glu-tRNA(Gln) amidotransferase B subunit
MPTISRRLPRARDGKAAANWVINELFGRLNKEGKEFRPRRSPLRSSAASST